MKKIVRGISRFPLMVLPVFLIGSALFCLLSSQFPDLAPAKIVTLFNCERNIVYKESQDYSLKMDIYGISRELTASPLLIYIHGGGWYSGSKNTGAGQQDIAEFVKHGYTVAALDYRLAPRYKYPAQLEDVRCAIEFLRANAERWGIDKNRVGVFGDSAGGHLAAMVGLTGADDPLQAGLAGESIRAVIDIYGPTDLALVLEKDKSDHIEHVFGTSQKDSEAIRTASPINHVTANAPPFLIIHGDSDSIVLPVQSQLLYERLVDCGVAATLLQVKNCDHRFTAVGGEITPTRSEISHIMIEFFDRYLKDVQVTT